MVLLMQDNKAANNCLSLPTAVSSELVVYRFVVVLHNYRDGAADQDSW